MRITSREGYLQYFEAGTLFIAICAGKEALEMNASCSYWISARDRITSQMVVREADRDPTLAGKSDQDSFSANHTHGTITTTCRGKYLAHSIECQSQ